ncbi:hypothetical protein BJ875DRAFT_484948 [Amylocarpus encephaloides]|uniref:Sacsin/Nov domain-containing protein n=1 Tax=Amylocarpus encephaloides TaxID=45428 RepID=A0A9P7YHP3_9HELO|nr:hypothetical protein BJ875DRAFT_484948 [Amylocarpus encephaloides]
MPVQAVAQNAQRQSVTTTLKSLCCDYPAGGGVLHELLQNADDAGAQTVKFYLDLNSYPIEPLISTEGDCELQGYQGPALLAYNNVIFTENDFKNLSSLGKSFKLNDETTTGGFGRGFNTVYNWTDSPAIVSREFLLILDPHERWSRGGPRYDFVASSKEPEMINHLKAFQAFMKKSDEALDGTIIRIPLRTATQAASSEISNRETMVSEVQDVLQKFATEFGKSGLLFMKNIDYITIGSTDGDNFELSVVDAEDVRA